MPGEEREVPIRGDTELRDRDFWGDLSDYYPRAVQDEIQMMSGHKWWWTVDALNVETGSIDLSRKDKVVRESFRVGPSFPRSAR